MSGRSASSAPVLKIHTRHVDVDNVWLEHVRERTMELDRFGNNIIGLDVEIAYNSNKRQQSHSWHVEISAKIKGHVLRATGEASDPERAFEKSRAVMEANLRRAARRHHWSRHGRNSTAKVAFRLAEAS